MNRELAFKQIDDRSAFFTTTICQAHAIVIRHDIDDSLYRELAAEYPQICHKNLPDREGALIHEFRVITVAHLADEIIDGHEVTIAGEEYSVARVFKHPGWSSRGKHDMVLIELRVPVKGVNPARLYREKDEVEKTVVLMGAQDTGNGKTGPISTDHVLRAATNVIDEVSTAWIKMRFDEPERATPLEGVSGPGDSGGPAFLKVDGVVYLLGDGSGQSTKATEGKEGVYGVVEHFARISSYIRWIERTVKKNSDETPR